MIPACLLAGLGLLLPACSPLPRAPQTPGVRGPGSPLPAAGTGLPPLLRFPRTPALSPDGGTIAFSHQGDLWTVPAGGGVAVRITANDAYDGSPRWSPDGTWIGFTSNRHGNRDVFLIPARGGRPVRVTWHSENETLHDWMDSERVLLGATRERWYSRRGQGLWIGYRDGRTPTLLGDFPALHAALSPDGKWICYERGHGDPRRRAYRGSASSDLWLFEIATGRHRPLTEFDGNDLFPMWGPGGKTLFFLSDRPCGGNEEGRDLGLWKVSRQGGAPQLVHHPGGESLRYPSISRDGRRIVAELGTGLVIIETGSGSSRQVEVRGSFDPSTPEAEEVTVSGGAGELALSKDGDSIAFVADGDLFVMRKHDKIHRAVRVTTDPAPDGNPVWVEDGKALLFVSERDGNGEVYRVRPRTGGEDGEEPPAFYKAVFFDIQRITETPLDEHDLSLSPDGKTLAWIEGRGRLVVGDPGTLKASRIITDGFDSPDFSWSPDSAWLAFSKVDDDFNSEVWLARADVEGLDPSEPGVEPFNVSRHPDDDYGPVWSPDGRRLAFTARREMNDETDVWMAWLRQADADRSEQERLEEQEARKKAREKKEKEKKKEEKEGAAGDEDQAGKKPPEKPAEPVRIDFDRLERRLVRITRREGNEAALGFDSESKRLFFNTTVGTRLTTDSKGEPGFYQIDLEGKKEEKKLESEPVASFLRHEKEILYVKGGKIFGRASEPKDYSFSVSFRRDRTAFRSAVLEQAWRALDRNYYDPGFHGHDWKASLEKWRPVAQAASTPEDFGEAMNWMLGEMNSSHMGYYGAGTSQSKETDRNATGVLGVLWDQDFSGPGRRVAEVVPETPAARAISRLHAGDVVLSVNGRAYRPGDNWYRQLVGQAEKDVLLRVRNTAGEERDVGLRPMAYRGFSGALYRRWAQNNRRQVEEDSAGKLGYIHIQGMGTGSLLEFERDLYNAGHGKEGLLIDVRENGGGWTTDMVLAMLMVRDHAFTIPRGGGRGYPQGRRIFAAWTKPVVVLCNENSYSNAEIFSWSIKTLGRGPLVGKQTYGAVISTGGQRLLDGSFVRLPTRGWYVNDGTGTNMEHHGCPPDYPVEILPGDYARGADPQLEKAIQVGLEAVR